MEISSKTKLFFVALTSVFLTTCSPNGDAPVYDIIITDGLIYDGSGGEPYVGDVALNDGFIAVVGDVGMAVAHKHIDATGLAVAPGFINMLSWGTETLIEDGRSMGDIKQGVTLEIFGEGWSQGPLSEETAKLRQESQGEIKYDITWRSFGGYLDFLVEKGVSPNVASFVGATTVRINTIGFENRPPTTDELLDMQNQVRIAMEEGAMGVGSSLIYAPAFYATTDELIALNKVVSEYNGMYISHMRSEGNRLLEAVEELITIAKEANVPAEIYHLKAAGEHNWHKMDEVIARVERARAEGQRITADMYNYIAGATGLDAAMPPWVQEGGYAQWVERLKDPEIRKKVKAEMARNADDWESFFYAAGPDRMILSSFKNPELRHLTGKTLSEAAKLRGTSPEDTAMDLVIEDGSRVGVIYFLMTEENMHKKIALPWVSFGSDAGSMATEGVFLNSNPHPRAYGNFSRLLGKYVREDGVITLAEAIKRLTSLPAQNLSLRQRGSLLAGFYGDVVVFDPDTIADKATFSEPHQYAIGMEHVFVNGVQVLKNGEHTGAMPGQVVRGPGWKGWEN